MIQSIAKLFTSNFRMTQIIDRLSDEDTESLPYMVFRLADMEKQVTIDNIKNCINEYRGQLKWVIKKAPASEINFILCPEIMYDMELYMLKTKVYKTQKEYFGNEFELYRLQALNDLESLFSHLQKQFPNYATRNIGQ